MYEQQPQQQGYTNQPVYYTQDSPSGDLLEKIKPDEIVEVFKRRLMGQEFINGEWVINPALEGKALTEKGAFEIATIMLSASSQNVSISKLKDPEIRERTRNIVKTVIRMCLRNWQEYGIKSSDAFYYIKEIVHTNTYATLKQPENAGIQKLVGGTYNVDLNESEHRQPNVWDKVLRG